MENDNKEQSQELELEKQRLARIQAESELLDRQREVEAARKKEQVQHEDALLTEAIRNGPKFVASRDMLVKLLRDPENGLEFDGDNVTALAGTRRVSISEFLEFVALEKHPYLADGRSLRSLQQRKAEPEKAPLKARSEFKTVAEKVDFINRWGDKAWSDLPMYPIKMVPLGELTLQQFSKLPIKEKTRLVSENPTLVEELTRRGRR